MFEVGAYYKFRIWETGEHGETVAKAVDYSPVKVTEVAMPLVTITSDGMPLIINTASLTFIRAQRVYPGSRD